MDIKNRVFGNVTVPMNEILKEWSNSFEEESSYDDYEIYLVSKDTFHQVEDDSAKEGTIDNYDYKLVIHAESNIEYINEDSGETPKMYYELYMVPVFNHLNSELQESITCGENDYEPSMQDIVSYGVGIILQSDFVEFAKGVEPVIDQAALNLVASVAEAINSLRGFYIDKYQNLLGNTGWDYLREYITGESATDMVLERWRKSQANEDEDDCEFE